MSLVNRELQEIWRSLRASGVERRFDLYDVRIRNLRGIRDLRLTFDYPVSVLAGPNGCGKSTVLFACACAYRVPGRGPWEFAPATLFPHFAGGDSPDLADSVQRTELEFYYLHDAERLSMVWRRNKAWTRSFMGRRGGRQPQRPLYLRRFSGQAHSQPGDRARRADAAAEEVTELPPELLIFAHRILPLRYRRMSLVRLSTRDLLFAAVEGPGDVSYSEFHMSSGERTILRMSKDLSQLEDALVLIDEVETGLHPYTQQQVMLELQRLALRRRLQVIVASHSAVVLNSVPPDARIVLDRESWPGDVRRLPAYRDVVQRSLYGQSTERLSILCQDDVAEGLIVGVLDGIGAGLGLRPDDFDIGRNAGPGDLPGHVRALGQCGKLNEFVFVLDGSSRDLQAKLTGAAEEFGRRIRPLLLPGDGPPEAWVWRMLARDTPSYASAFGLAADELRSLMRDIEALLDGAPEQRPASRAALGALADELDRTEQQIARAVGRAGGPRRAAGHRGLPRGAGRADRGLATARAVASCSPTMRLGGAAPGPPARRTAGRAPRPRPMR